MKPFVITAAALGCAIAVAVSTRVLLPSLILIVRAIEDSLTPTKPQLATASAAAVVVTEAAPVKQAAPKKTPARKTRSRRATTKVIALKPGVTTATTSATE